MAKNNVLVTGSNSGFGRLISLALARRGHTVVATMRSPFTKNKIAAEELRTIANAERLALHVVPLDVTDEQSVLDAIRSAESVAGHLDVVVNNAGYAVGGLNETVTPEQVLAQLDTNVVGAHRVNRAALPGLRKRGAGLIVHISSTMGRLTTPFYGFYSASKWALEAMAESYRYELKSTGIDVSIVQPGTFNTQFRASIVLGADLERERGYGPLDGAYAKLAAMFEQMMMSNPDAPNPNEVAEAVVALVETEPGKRPARVVVDRASGDGPAAVNKVAAEVQRGLLTAMGLTSLAD